MRVLIVGGGGREHAIAWKLAQSPRVTELIAAPGNPSMARDAECVAVGVMDLDGQVALARERQPDLVVIGPEDPLGAGLADRIAALGIPVAGPSQAAARIESSKAWAKHLMHEDGIPTAQSRTVSTAAEAEAAITEIAPAGPVVIKADGLAAGKGVVIAANAADGLATARAFLSGDAFGESGTTVVIEEFLEGTEISLLCLTDGETIYPLASACDYKRLGDGDIGPNTGGMGVYAPAPFVTDQMLATIRQTILEPTLAGMTRRGARMRGVLYAGLIATADGVKVIEFNARFGDPETQVVLPLLRGDLFELLYGVATGTLGSVSAPIFTGAAVGVAVASGGYPASYAKGYPIDGLPEDTVAWSDRELVFHAGTARDDKGAIVTAGGRVLTVVAVAESLAAARSHVYELVPRIAFEGAIYRTDIALREM